VNARMRVLFFLVAAVAVLVLVLTLGAPDVYVGPEIVDPQAPRVTD
jgi:hypothetical protein